MSTPENPFDLHLVMQVDYKDNAKQARAYIADEQLEASPSPKELVRKKLYKMADELVDKLNF